MTSTRIRRTATHLFVISLKMLCWCLFCLTTLEAIGSFQLFPGSKESLKRSSSKKEARPQAPCGEKARVGCNLSLELRHAGSLGPRLETGYEQPWRSQSHCLLVLKMGHSGS